MNILYVREETSHTWTYHKWGDKITAFKACMIVCHPAIHFWAWVTHFCGRANDGRKRFHVPDGINMAKLSSWHIALIHVFTNVSCACIPGPEMAWTTLVVAAHAATCIGHSDIWHTLCHTMTYALSHSVCHCQLWIVGFMHAWLVLCMHSCFRGFPKVE